MSGRPDDEEVTQSLVEDDLRRYPGIAAAEDQGVRTLFGTQFGSLRGILSRCSGLPVRNRWLPWSSLSQAIIGAGRQATFSRLGCIGVVIGVLIPAVRLDNSSAPQAQSDPILRG
jgi:hypothetical protein